MVLIIAIGTTAALALRIWRLLRGRGNENMTMNEARRTAGVVNAVSYALMVILDAMSMRRGASLATTVGGRTVPTSIGGPANPDE